MFTKKEIEKVQELKKQRYSNKKISEELGMSISSVKKFLKNETVKTKETQMEKQNNIETIEKHQMNIKKETIIPEYDIKLTPHENAIIKIKKSIQIYENEKNLSDTYKEILNQLREMAKISDMDEKKIEEKAWVKCSKECSEIQRKIHADYKVKFDAIYQKKQNEIDSLNAQNQQLREEIIQIKKCIENNMVEYHKFLDFCRVRPSIPPYY